MKRATLFLLAGLAFAGLSCLENQGTFRARLAPWDEFGFRALRTPAARSLHFSFSAPALSGGSELRLLFELQPGNADYYYVGVQRERLTLGKVECGVELYAVPWPENTAPDASPFSKPQEISVTRSRGRISITVGTRRVIDRSDDTFTQGGAAFGAIGLLEVNWPRVRVQTAGEIYATDNFMRTKEEEAAWRVQDGEWETDWRDNPALSANAFTYSGRPSSDKPAISLLGESWWDDYNFEVSVQPMGTDGVGLVFRYAGPFAYYLFRHAGAGSSGEVQLVRVSDGRETILARRTAIISPGQWYRMRIVANRTLLEGYVDGNMAVQVRDDSVALGQVGLYVADRRGAKFDDVFVQGERGLVEDFGNNHVSWSPRAGEWSVNSSSGRPVLRAAGPSWTAHDRSAKLLVGEETWTDYRVAARLVPGLVGRAGIVAHYRDESTYNEFIHDAQSGRCELALVRDDQRKVVAEGMVPASLASRELALKVAGGVIVGEVDGRRVVSHFDSTVASGKAGLCVGTNSIAAFECLLVTFPREVEPVLTQLDTFAREATMANWAAAKTDWEERPTDVWGHQRRIFWHRGAFFGGAEVRAKAFFDPLRKGSLHLYSGCELSERSNRRIVSGYELVLRVGNVRESGSTLELLRNGAAVATATGIVLRGSTQVALKAIEGYVLGEVDGKVTIVFHESAPLRGPNTGYVAENVIVKPEDVDVFCENTISDDFVRAATDWRTAGGEWFVMNRWRCDPRWSFFGGESMNGVAAVWNKHRFEGDVVVEVAAAIRHQQNRGPNYTHASDINIVICGDGESLASGYGFFYGGWGNTRSAITRNGQIVASSSNIIPSRTGDIHRRWFYLKAVRRGGQLQFYVDNVLLLEYTDPAPLPDGQVALWTWKNGLLIARTRIAAAKLGSRESFTSVFPEVSPCVYSP